MPTGRCRRARGRPARPEGGHRERRPRVVKALATILAALALALALAAPALASDARPTLAELEREVICPTCQTTLDQSSSPIADRMRRFIGARIAAGDTKGEIKEALAAEFGQAVLAEPPKRGFHLLAWLLPLVGLGAGAAVVAALVWRWSRRRESPEGGGPSRLPPDVERRLDAELAALD